MVNKILIGVAVIAGLLGERALAADLPLAAPVPVPVPVPSWSGPYIGVALGARFDAVTRV